MVNRLTEKEYRYFQWYELLIYFPAFIAIILISGIALFIDCSQGHHWAAHITMAIFSLIFIIIEIIVYIKRPNPWREKEIEGRCKYIRRIISSETVAWGFQALFTFLGHFDIYTDLCFIMVASDSSAQQSLWILSLLFFILAYIPKLMFYSILLFRSFYEGCWCCNEIPPNAKIQLVGCYFFELKHHIHILKTMFNIEIKVKFKLLMLKSLEELGQFIMQQKYIRNISEYCPEEGGVNFILYISLVLSAIMGLYSCITLIIDLCNSKVTQDHAQLNLPNVDLSCRMEKGKEEEFCDFVCKTLENNRVLRLNLSIIYLFICAVNRS